MASETKNVVEVWIYDLSKGLARAMSMAILGKQLDGIWHTAIVVYGKEYFYGGDSIEYCSPGGTILGQPNEKVSLGSTEIPYEIFHEHLRELSQTSFRGCDYHLVNRNCNNFSSEVAQFLTGNDIPSHITNLPQEVLNTPFGQMIRPMLDSMTVNPGSGSQRVFGESSPSHRVITPSVGSQASNPPQQSSVPSASASQSTPIETSPSKVVTFTHKQTWDVDSLCNSSSLTTQESSLLAELIDYSTTDNVTWSISPAHIKLLGHLLSTSEELRKAGFIWRLFQELVVKPNSLDTLKRCDQSVFMSRIDIENLESLKFLCNLCSTFSGYTWTLTSRRPLLEALPGSLTLCMSNPEHLLALVSTVLNVSIHHRLVDDLDISCTCAIVEFLNSNDDLQRAAVERLLQALLNFMSRNREVKMLAFSVGLNMDKYKSMLGQSDSSALLKDVIDGLSGLEVE